MDHSIRYSDINYHKQAVYDFKDDHKFDYDFNKFWNRKPADGLILPIMESYEFTSSGILCTNHINCRDQLCVNLDIGELIHGISTQGGTQRPKAEEAIQKCRRCGKYIRIGRCSTKGQTCKVDFIILDIIIKKYTKWWILCVIVLQAYAS